MKERWYLQTKKADFNEISRKFNISPILARLLRNRNVIGDENIKKCVEFGINKINVGCDFMNANVDSIKKHLKKYPDINYWVLMHQVEIDSQELVKKYIHLSGSEGKSL